MQSLQNQKHKIFEYAKQHKILIDELIELEISSKKSQKERKIGILLDKTKDGDTLICTELSLLGRNMLEILNLVEQFNQHKIKLIFTNQPEIGVKGEGRRGARDEVRKMGKKR